MHLRRFVTLSVVLLLSACGGDKFPYPPQYVSVEDVGMHALPAPPSKGSPVYNKEIDSILVRQSKLTDAQKAVIAKEDHISPEMIITPVLGAKYDREHYPALYTLMAHSSSDAWRISDAVEDFWMSPRPWYADDRVQLLVPKISRPGYPSGHTTTNTVWAHALGELFPEKRVALLARAMEIGSHRIDGGAHFPHDVKGGRQMGDIIYSKMQKSAQFQQELATAKAEIVRQ